MSTHTSYRCDWCLKAVDDDVRIGIRVTPPWKQSLVTRKPGAEGLAKSYDACSACVATGMPMKMESDERLCWLVPLTYN